MARAKVERFAQSAPSRKGRWEGRWPGRGGGGGAGRGRAAGRGGRRVRGAGIRRLTPPNKKMTA